MLVNLNLSQRTNTQMPKRAPQNVAFGRLSEDVKILNNWLRAVETAKTPFVKGLAENKLNLNDLKAALKQASFVHDQPKIAALEELIDRDHAV